MSSEFTGSGYIGSRPMNFSGATSPSSGGVVKTPGPGRVTDENTRLSHAIQAGLMAYGFDGGAVASDLCLMPTDLQRRFGEIMFPVLGMWAELASIHTSPSHPLYNEYKAARVMLSHLFPSHPPTRLD